MKPRPPELDSTVADRVTLPALPRAKTRRRPIAEGPTNGTTVRLHHEQSCDVTIGRYDRITKRWILAEFFKSSDGKLLYSQPTHWSDMGGAAVREETLRQLPQQ